MIETIAVQVHVRIQLFRVRLSEKAQKCTRQDRKVVWVYTGILHIDLENCTSLYFWTWRICFSQEAFFCSFTSTVACIWVSKILLKFSVAKSTSLPHVWRGRKRANSRLLCRYISLVFSTCSSSILLPILPLGLFACTFVPFFRQPFSK